MSVWVMIILVSTLSFKGLLPRLFTTDPCVLDAISVPMFVVAFSVTCHVVQSSLAGVIRASGKQLLGSIINVFTHWVVGLPLGIVVTIVAGLGAAGYWIALTVAPFLQGSLYAVILLLMNWRKVSEKAQRMAGKEPEPNGSLVQARFHVEGEGEANVVSSNNSIDCEASGVIMSVLSSVPVEDGETHCQDHGEQVNEQDDDAVPLLPHIKTEPSPLAGSLGEKGNSDESSSQYRKVNCKTSNHRDHLPGSDDDLPLISEGEEGESTCEGSQMESDTDVETDTEPVTPPTSTATSVSPIPQLTIVLRVATLLAMIVLLAVSVAVSQLYVYQSSTGLCLPENNTLSFNVTINISTAQPAAACAVY